MRMWFGKWVLAIFTMLILNTFTLSSQEHEHERRTRRNHRHLEEQADSSAKPQLPDSLIAFRDSVARADSIARKDSINLLKKSSLEAPAFTTAKDSIIEDFSDGKQIIYY